jgi:hypothetical protein
VRAAGDGFAIIHRVTAEPERGFAVTPPARAAAPA